MVKTWILIGAVSSVIVAALLVSVYVPKNESSSNPSTEVRVPSAATVTVYDDIVVPENSIVLNLSGRNLSGSLKAEIRHLTQLEVLDISNNNFTGLPAEIGQLSHLRVLNLSHNPLTGLPYELGNLQSLEVLDVRGTNYAAADLERIVESLPDTTQVLTE